MPFYQATRRVLLNGNAGTGITKLPAVGPFAGLTAPTIASLTDYSDDGDASIASTIGTPKTAKTMTITGNLGATADEIFGGYRSSIFVWVNKLIFGPASTVSLDAGHGQDAAGIGGSGADGASGGGGGAGFDYIDYGPDAPDVAGGGGGSGSNGLGGNGDSPGDPGTGDFPTVGGYGGFPSGGASESGEPGGPGFGGGGAGGPAIDNIDPDNPDNDPGPSLGGGGGGGAGVYCAVGNEFQFSPTCLFRIGGGGGGQPGNGGGPGFSGGAGSMYLACRKWTATTFSVDSFNGAIFLIEISGPQGSETLTNHGSNTNISFNNL